MQEDEKASLFANAAFSFFVPISCQKLELWQLILADYAKTSESIGKPEVRGLPQNSVSQRINNCSFVVMFASIHQSNLNHGIADCSLLLAALYVIAVFMFSCDSQCADLVFVGIAFNYHVELFFLAHKCFLLKRFEHDEFFEQVLRQGLSPKSRGKRSAIIGEPGAGKTTLLQQIADWVFEDTDQDVAIWVSLADLQGRTLEEYLLNVWLKEALKRARVTPEMEDSLVELFNRGRVWLLLDGVDEMVIGATTGGLPLQTIAKQLTAGWVSSARVVLTCRLNVWDAGKNALERFDTYRTLEFSYGNGKKPDSDQVNQFISKWFEPSDPQLGKALRTALDQRGKERIKDLVKNPLRLALMCYSWQRRQGELPKTKATLYQRFVEVFYEWKQEYFPSTSATRQELNEALGRLAVEAMAQSSSRFRLTRRFVCEVLGEPDAPLRAWQNLTLVIKLRSRT